MKDLLPSKITIIWLHIHINHVTSLIEYYCCKFSLQSLASSLHQEVISQKTCVYCPSLFTTLTQSCAARLHFPPTWASDMFLFCSRKAACSYACNWEKISASCARTPAIRQGKASEGMSESVNHTGITHSLICSLIRRGYEKRREMFMWSTRTFSWRSRKMSWMRGTFLPAFPFS